MAWLSSSRGPRSLQTQERNETIKPLPWKVCCSRLLMPGITTFSFWGACSRMPLQSKPQDWIMATGHTALGWTLLCHPTLSGNPPDSCVFLLSLLCVAKESWSSPVPSLPTVASSPGLPLPFYNERTLFFAPPWSVPSSVV